MLNYQLQTNICGMGDGDTGDDNAACGKHDDMADGNICDVPEARS